MALATNSECIGFIFFNFPKNKGEIILKKISPNFSPILFSFLLPIKNAGLIIPRLVKLNFFSSSSTSPLFLGKLKKMKPIDSKFVARAMIKVAKNDFQKTIFESNEIVELNNS